MASAGAALALACVGEALLPAGAEAASPGSLDPTFGTGGFVLAQLGPGASPESSVHAVALQPDGKVIVAGAASTPTGVRSQLLAARLNADGSFDPSFGTAGVRLEQLGAGSAPESLAFAVALQPDGKIVLAGAATDASSRRQLLVARLSANGALDETFGTGGVFTTQLGGGTSPSSQASAVALQPDGKIVAAGSASVASGANQTFVVRLTASGALDASFGTEGKRVGQHGQGAKPGSEANAVVLQPDGKIVVGGDATDTSGRLRLAVFRLDADGNFDASFAGGEPTFAQLGQGPFPETIVTCLALQPDGKIIAGGGTTDAGDHRELMVARLGADGSFDTAFGGGPGFVTQPGAGLTPEAEAEAFALSIQPNGRLLAGGYATAADGSSPLLVARFNSDGSLDASFGSGGVVATRPQAAAERASQAIGLALQPDGKIVAAGLATNGSGGFQFLVARLIGEQPSAVFSAVPNPALAGEALRFDGSASSDPVGTIVSYSWTFGDGSIGTGAQTAHAYLTPGSYSATLTVTDNHGFTASSTRTITVIAKPAQVAASNPPVVSGARESNRTWREGNRLAREARAHRPPIGTKFSFTINESARLRFTFQQPAGGRRVGGKCVAVTGHNRRRRACKRSVVRGVLSFTAHSGTNMVSFQGRLSTAKRLPLGPYTLVIVATSATGQRSAPVLLSFTIVR